MDPITIIVTALATGAASALKETAGKAIKDAYDGIKTLIKRKYTGVDLGSLEKKPASEVKRASVGEDLRDAGASDDQELLRQAQALIEAIRQHDPEAAKAIGIDLKDVEAGNLRIGKVTSEGGGVVIERGTFHGDIEIDDVRAGNVDDENPSSRQ